jgi:CheY-like chemotaxis protein
VCKRLLFRRFSGRLHAPPLNKPSIGPGLSSSDRRAFTIASLLVVDDDPDVLDAVCAVLRGAGHRVEAASGGLAALGVLDRVSIDLLLTDVVMRGMNGFNLARRAVQRWPALRVLYYSGFTEFTIGRHEALSGKFLQKPLESDDLRREVAWALAARPR